MPEGVPANPGMMVTVARCTSCGALDPGPREICPKCHKPTLAAVDVPGAGTLVSWTMIRRPPAQYREDGAYAVAIVRLDAGVQVTGRLNDPCAAVTPGVRVRARAAVRDTVLFEAVGSSEDN
jgi:uncharacterized OB-fold protein